METPTAVVLGDPLLRDLVERATDDVAQRVQVQRALPQADGDALTSRIGFLDSLRALQWLQEQAGAKAADLDGYWDILESRTEDQIRCLLPRDVAEAFSVLAACGRRCPELVRLLSQQCRRLSRSFSPDEIALVVRAYGDMGWRSTGTLAHLGRRLVQLLEGPEAPLVTARHLAALVGVYPRLAVPWSSKRGKQHEAKELAMWKAVAVAVPSRLEQMSARDAAVILNAYARMNFAFAAIHRNVARMYEVCATHLVPRIASAETKGGDGFIPRYLGLIANAYAKTRAGPYVLPLMQAISSRAIGQMQLCSQQDVAVILNAFAKLGVADSAVFQAAALVIGPQITTYTPQSLALVAHAFAKQHVRHVAVFEHIAQMSIRVMDKFKPMELANVGYAYGHVQIRHQALLSRLRDEVIYRGTVGKSLQNIGELYRFSLRSVEQLTQAFARLGMHDQRLFFVLFDMARQRVRDFARRMAAANEASRTDGEQELDLAKAAALASWGQEPEMLDGNGLSMLLSAFAKSRADFHSLLRWAPQQVLGLKGQFTTFQLAAIFNSCTRLGIDHPPLYSELLKHAKLRMPQMPPSAVAMLVRGMARAQLYNRVVMRQAVKVVSPRLRDLDVVDVGALLTGCADMLYRDERFLRLLAAVAQNRAEEMSNSQLATAFAAFSQMRISHHKWFDAMLFEIFKRQHGVSEKDSTNVAYGMLLIAAAERHAAGERSKAVGAKGAPGAPEPGLVYPFDKHRGVLYSLLSITNDHRRDLNYAAVFQLQIIELFLRLLLPSVYAEMRQELKILLAKARRVNLMVDDYMQNSSRLHRRISQWFTRVGLHHRSEVILGPFMLDMVIGHRVIVEVDGPYHFYRDTNSRTSTSLLKHMVLVAMGFHVKHLPYQEWAQCGTAERKTLYCSTFWRDVFQATLPTRQLEDRVASEEQARLLPLVDVMEMLVSAQAGSPGGLGEEAEDEPTVIEGGHSGEQLPAFYSVAGDGGGRRQDGAGEEETEGSVLGFDVDAEASAGARSVEALLAEHQQAEEELAKDRRQEVSARQRGRLDFRQQRRASGADGWPRAGCQADSAGHDSEPRDGCSSSSAARAAGEGTTSFLHAGAVEAQMKALMPRSDRRTMAHSSSGLFDRAALEEDTDASDEEEEERDEHSDENDEDEAASVSQQTGLV